MDLFREALEFCDLSDIYIRGSIFTWPNSRIGGGFTKEKLDRAMANSTWYHLYSSSTGSVLPAIRSDHSPLLLNVSSSSRSGIDCIYNSRRRSIFRWEAGWQFHGECLDSIKGTWGMGSSRPICCSSFRAKLNRCKQAIVKWKSCSLRNK